MNVSIHAKVLVDIMLWACVILRLHCYAGSPLRLHMWTSWSLSGKDAHQYMPWMACIPRRQVDTHITAFTLPNESIFLTSLAHSPAKLQSCKTTVRSHSPIMIHIKLRHSNLLNTKIASSILRHSKGKHWLNTFGIVIALLQFPPSKPSSTSNESNHYRC